LRKSIADGVDQQVSKDRHCIARTRSVMIGNFGSSAAVRRLLNCDGRHPASLCYVAQVVGGKGRLGGLVSRAKSTPATAPTAICAARPAGPRAPKMPTVPSRLFMTVNSTKSANAPARPKTITRKPVKRGQCARNHECDKQGDRGHGGVRQKHAEKIMRGPGDAIGQWNGGRRRSVGVACGAGPCLLNEIRVGGAEPNSTIATAAATNATTRRSIQSFHDCVMGESFQEETSIIADDRSIQEIGTRVSILIVALAAAICATATADVPPESVRGPPPPAAASHSDQDRL